MKKTIFVCLLALGCAATLPAMAQTDAKAKTVLESASKKMSSLKSLKANFALHLTGSKGKVNDTKKGTLYVKGNKYNLEMAGQTIICDGKTVWTYNKAAKEVQVSSYNPNEQTLSPAKLFTNFYDREYNYSYAGTKSVNGKSCDVVEMVPKDRSKQFSKINLDINKTNSTLVGGEVFEKNGNKYSYDINNFTPNANVPDSYFTFDSKAHPGVEVIDLR